MSRVGCRAVFVSATVAACSSSGKPDFAKPPASAVAHCTFEQHWVDDYFAMSGLHFDARNRLVQFDGHKFDDSDLVRTSTVIEYDGEDRVVRTSDRVRNTTVTYAPGEAIESNGFQTIRYELDDAGRVLRRLVNQNQVSVAYEYDALGRVARYFVGGGTDTRYTYDAEGRLAGRVGVEEGASQIAYTQNGPELEIRETDAVGLIHRWKIHVDAAGRTDRVDYLTRNVTVSYTYGTNVIEQTIGPLKTTARGECPVPTVAFAPSHHVIGKPIIDRGLRFPGVLFDGVP